jgi:hypothetical protein
MRLISESNGVRENKASPWHKATLTSNCPRESQTHTTNTDMYDSKDLFGVGCE